MIYSDSLFRKAAFFSLLCLFINLSVSAQNWYLPDTVNGPAVNAAEAPDGYTEANFCCVQAAVDADPFCLDTNWDFFCQTAYDSCIEGCTDEMACNYSPLAVGCSFSTAASVCTYPKWHIPEEPSSEDVPAVFQCQAPEGYITPADQCCIENLTAVDPFCTVTSWDNLCQNKFEACVEGCTDPSACNYSAFATCSTQAESNAACTYESWFLPGILTSGPAYFGCTPPLGYEPAEACCIEYTFSVDGFCVDNDWDSFCFFQYNECLEGCNDSEACNYDPLNTCSIGCEYEQWFVPGINSNPFVPLFTCEAPAGYFPADEDCLNPSTFVIGCSDTGWSEECLEAYLFCTNEFGCTNETACNYNQYSTVNDGSCTGLKGCTNSATTNYNPWATCDDGSCDLILVEGCAGDFNNDGFVTITDLSGFLGVFGTICTP
ncbi:MAG: hypothetical protein AB8B53_10585 [Flavobacteriales bacterium]